jgi:hypothetical protein
MNYKNKTNKKLTFGAVNEQSTNNAREKNYGNAFGIHVGADAC